MKIENKNKTGNSILNKMRDIRNKISLEIKDMNFEQLKDYFKKKKALHPKATWKKNK